jgi:enamine deaminase RidA (YjgF/YER057c/UK114 family)
MTVQFPTPEGLARGSYSHVAVVAGGRTLYVSGQVAVDASGKVVGATFAEQAEKVFDNLQAALAAGGAEFRHVVKLNTYVRDLSSAKVALLREIRARRFGGHLPASTLVGTPALVHEDMMLEVEAVAVVE